MYHYTHLGTCNTIVCPICWQYSEGRRRFTAHLRSHALLGEHDTEYFRCPYEKCRLMEQDMEDVESFVDHIVNHHPQLLNTQLN